MTQKAGREVAAAAAAAAAGGRGDSFSINRFAQGLVGDFLGKVLGPSRTRSNLVDKSAALGA